jgi:hypothetical protein
MSLSTDGESLSSEDGGFMGVPGPVKWEHIEYNQLKIWEYQ